MRERERTRARERERDMRRERGGRGSGASQKMGRKERRSWPSLKKTRKKARREGD